MATGWDRQITRQVVEHLVAAELGRMNYAATPFAGNIPMYDLLAADKRGYAIPIQVKAIRGGAWQFDAKDYLKIETSNDGEQKISGKIELLNSELLCIFVLLKGSGSDEFYIFSLRDLQNYCEGVYKPRTAQSKNPKSTHCAVWPRNLEKFLNNWELLKSRLSA